MAKRARKQRTEAERAEIEADRIAASERTGVYADIPEGVTVVELEPTPEGMAIMHRALAEAVGEMEEDPLEKHMGDGEEGGIVIEFGDEAEGEGEPKEPNSIVKDKFKEKYIANAIAMGETKKAAKRSNWDWLAQQLAAA